MPTLMFLKPFNPKTHVKMIVTYPDGLVGTTIVLKKNVPALLAKGFKVAS